MTLDAMVVHRRDKEEGGDDVDHAGAGERHQELPIRGGWSLVRVRRLGLAVLVLQLAGLLVWSAVLAGRFALTMDFATYHQAWWLVGHGNLDPYDTVQGFPFWQGHGEFLLWPLALVGDLWPHPVTMLWVQDVAVVGAETVAFLWLCELAERSAAARRDRRWAVGLAALGVLLLVADPWIYWSVSFDFHFEPVGVVFLLLAARDLWRRPERRRVWVWVVLALACGDVVTTYLVGIGASAVVAGRRWRRRGAQVMGASIAWALVASAVLGANKAAGLGAGYGYLVAGGGAVPSSVGLPQLVRAVVAHPVTVVRVLWSKWLDLYAAVAAPGLLGALWPWVAVPIAVVLLENGLNGQNVLFISPSFQDLFVYLLVPVGTVALLASVACRHGRVTLGLAVLVGANALGWGAVWLPQTVPHWLRVSPGAAATLASVSSRIPSGDEVVASQGVAGGFSERRFIYPVAGPGSVPLHTRTVWAVIALRQGVESATVPDQSAWVAEMAGPLHAELVAHADGIWAFRWTPAPGITSLLVPGAVRRVAAWTATGSAGVVIPAGPSADWTVEADGKPGYVVEGDYWLEPAGRYQAAAVMSSTVPVDVEAWNATSDTLLARRHVPPTDGLANVTMPVELPALGSEDLYRGLGPFRILPVPPAEGNRLEIRVWTAGGGPVSVVLLELVPAGS